MTLKISISGVRGITGGSLTNEVVSDFSKAFATYLGKGQVVLGRDSRASGENIKDICVKSLNQLGLDVIYVGIAPTPTVQLMVKELKADGGLIITASHNPGQWNGLKFVRSDGIFLNENQANELIDKYKAKAFEGKGGQRRQGTMKTYKDPYKAHISKILDSVDLEAIKKRKFKVVLDSCNGAGSIITVKLLEELGCDVIRLYADPDKPFPHDPEPVPENLKDLCDKVKEAKADIGFAQDADADRLAIVTDEGKAPGEEYTLAVTIEHVLSRAKKGATVVVNLSTSMMIDDIANKYGAKVIRTKIGEVNVAEEMVKQKGLIGGEGNGGVMYPRVGFNRDSLIGIGLVLNAMASKGKSISQMVKDIPGYHIVKRKIDCPNKLEADKLIENIRSNYKNERIDERDGIKVIFKDSWLHVRSSNTEPIVRIIAEAKSQEKALRLSRSIELQ